MLETHLEILELLRCKTAQIDQKFSNGWRPSHGDINLIFWHKIDIWVSFPILSGWGQSRYWIKSYDCFTEKCSFWRAKRRCRERRSVEWHSRATINTPPNQQTDDFFNKVSKIVNVPPKFPLFTEDPILCLDLIHNVLLSHWGGYAFIFWLSFRISIRFGEKWKTPSDFFWNSSFYLLYDIYYFFV